MSRSWDLGSDLSDNLSVSLSGFFSPGQDPNHVYNADQYDTLLQDNGVAANDIGTVTPVIWAALGYANANAFWDDMYTNGILKSAIIAEIPSPPMSVDGTFLSSDQVYPALVSNTFSSVPLGAPASDRIMVLSLTYRQGAPASSVTINGVSATLAATGVTSSSFYSEIWQAPVPNGVSGDIVVNVSGGNWVAWGLHRLTGANAVVEDSSTDFGSASLSTSLTATDGAYIIATNTNGSGGDNAWSLPLVENYDETVVTPADSAGGASLSVTSVGLTTVSVTATGSSGSQATLACVSYALA